MLVCFARPELTSLLGRRGRYAQQFHYAIAFLLLSFLSGCGEEKPKYPSATIDGIVSIDGTPVKEGALQFIPGKDVQGQVTEAKIADGRFTAKNVPVGQVRVMFNITRPTGKMITEYSTPYPEIENLVPKNSRDGVDLTVAGNDNVKFELHNEPAADSTSAK